MEFVTKVAELKVIEITTDQFGKILRLISVLATLQLSLPGYWCGRYCPDKKKTLDDLQLPLMAPPRGSVTKSIKEVKVLQYK